MLRSLPSATWHPSSLLHFQGQGTLAFKAQIPHPLGSPTAVYTTGVTENTFGTFVMAGTQVFVSKRKRGGTEA